jgi:hypothetical protein
VEVDAVLRFALPDAERLDGGAYVSAEEWTDGTHASVNISLADFVPKGEGTIPLVAAAARDAIAGEGPRRVFTP